MTTRRSKKKPTKAIGNGDNGWQAQKSAMTCNAILDAAVDCFVSIGFAGTTTATIANRAGVSRGAMQHHFASKDILVRAAIEHLHHKLVDLYTSNIHAVANDMRVDERNRRGLQGYWNYLCSDLFVAYHELCVAGRTDPQLQRILEDSIVRFDKAITQTNTQLFPEWAAKGQLFELAMDLTKFLMEGMAVSHIVTKRKQRQKRLMDYLADRLEEIFHSDEQNTAIRRHTMVR